MRKYIAFAHKKEQILFIALKNPNLCAEFNAYTASTILNILQTHPSYFPTLSHIRQIKAYFPKSLSTQKHKNLSSRINKEKLLKELKEAKTYRQRREIISHFQQQGFFHFLPPKHFAQHNEILETYFLQAYLERCNQIFINRAKNPKIHEAFQRIQTIIQNH